MRLLRSSGRSVPQLARELGCSPQSLRNWARQLDIDRVVLRLPHLTVRSIATAAAALVFLLGCGSLGDEPPDAAAAKRVVADYLAATEARDERAISARVAPGVDATADIAQRLELYGGRRAADAAVQYATDFGGQMTDVVITDRSATDPAETDN